MTVLLVAVGGMIGVLARYGLGTSVSPDSLPWMTCAINIAGSFVLGAVLAWSAELSEPVRTGLAVGFCGGFTTFSTVTVQVLLDAKGGDTGFAMFYLAASVVGGLAAAALGYYAGRVILPLAWTRLRQAAGAGAEQPVRAHIIATWPPVSRSSVLRRAT